MPSATDILHVDFSGCHGVFGKDTLLPKRNIDRDENNVQGAQEDTSRSAGMCFCDGNETRFLS